MSKKILSVFLSVCLVAGIVFSVPMLNTTAATTAFSQDFESYEYDPAGTTKNRLANYTLYTSDGTDGNAHSGTKSIYRSATTNTYRVAVFPEETTAPITAGSTYELKFWIKIASAVPGTGTIQLMYSGDRNNANSQVSGSSLPNISVLKKPNETSTNVDTTKVGEWQEITYTFTATHSGYLNLSGWGTNEYYLDDISLKKMAKSTISFESNGGSAVTAVTGDVGSAITMPAAPTKEGLAFDGWYTDAALTQRFTATTFPETSMTLYAKWKLPGTFSQDFESYEYDSAGTTKSRLAGYTLYISDGTDGNAHSGTKSLYRAAANNTYRVAVFPEETTTPIIAGKAYELSFWIKIASAVPGTGTIQLMYSGDRNNAHSQVAGTSIPNISILKKVGEASTNVDATKVGEWQKITYLFTATHDGFLNLSGWGTNEYYLDDIILKEVPKITITMDTCGGNAIEPMGGAAGQSIASVPTPTHPNEMSFAGWFTDQEYTERFSFKEFPTADMTVYAKWIRKGSFEQTFEGYYYENDTSNTTYSKDVLSVYHATSADDEYVHSGKTSLRYYQKLNAEAKTYGFSIFDPTMGQLEIGEKYYVSYWMKAKEISNTFYHAVYNNSVVNNMFADYTMKGYFTTHKDVIDKTGDVSEYFFGPEGKYAVSEPDENGWVKFTFETTATDKYFSIYVNWDAEVYIDDVVIEPLPAGVVANDYSKPYCEPLYDEINHQQPDALNKKSSTPMVYPLELTARGDYVFSAALSKNAKDGYIALAWDAEGKNMIDGTKVTAGESVSARMILGKSNLIYLVVYNPVGEGMIERATLCRTLSAKATLGEQTETYPDYGTKLPELSVLLQDSAYTDVFLDAVFETGLKTDASEEETTSPKTGDASAIALVMVAALISLVIMFYCIKKRRGSNCID